MVNIVIYFKRVLLLKISFLAFLAIFMISGKLLANSSLSNDSNNISNNVISSNKITLCCDNTTWFPFIILKQAPLSNAHIYQETDDATEVSGLHIDIVRLSLQKLGYDPIFKPMPFEACLKEAREGKVDGVVSAVYKDDRTAYLLFPVGAAIDTKSLYRITQVEYRVINSSFNPDGKPNTYIFNGNPNNILPPIRMASDYRLSEEIQKKGLKIIQSDSDLINYQQLIQEKTGSIVDVDEVASYYNVQPEFASKLIIQKLPVSSRSYYLAFTKKGTIDLERAQMIWMEIANNRGDKNISKTIFEKYIKY